MPKKLERKLRARARRLGLGKKRTNAYVYGTLRRAGWKPRRR
jgi:hypothetical protein